MKRPKSKEQGCKARGSARHGEQFVSHGSETLAYRMGTIEKCDGQDDAEQEPEGNATKRSRLADRLAVQY